MLVADAVEIWGQSEFSRVTRGQAGWVASALTPIMGYSHAADVPQGLADSDSGKTVARSMRSRWRASRTSPPIALAMSGTPLHPRWCVR